MIETAAGWVFAPRNNPWRLFLADYREAIGRWVIHEIEWTTIMHGGLDLSWDLEEEAAAERRSAAAGTGRATGEDSDSTGDGGGD